MSLLKNIAGTAARTMHPSEVEQVLEHTLEVMLQRMTPTERVDFAERMVNGTFKTVLASLTPEEHRQLTERLLRESAPR
jgi:Mg/Co/Ni transporter MgtE